MWVGWGGGEQRAGAGCRPPPPWQLAACSFQLALYRTCRLAASRGNSRTSQTLSQRTSEETSTRRQVLGSASYKLHGAAGSQLLASPGTLLAASTTQPQQSYPKPLPPSDTLFRLQTFQATHNLVSIPLASMFKPTAQTAFWRGKDLASRMYTRRKRATFPGGGAITSLQRFKLAGKAVRQFVVTHRLVATYIEQERRRPLLPATRAPKRRRTDDEHELPPTASCSSTARRWPTWQPSSSQ